MHWNHRVVCSKDDHLGDPDFTIREVFYEDDEVIGWTSDPMEPFGESLDELRQDLARMTECLDLPVLDEEALEASVRAKGEQ